jgi:peptide deformylase
MAILEIITLPDPRLKTVSEPVMNFDTSLAKLVKDMSETMAFAKGIGLAAIQVAVPKRLLILDIGDLNDTKDYREGDDESERKLASRRKKSLIEVYINPEIIESSGEVEFEEGCLSVPGVYSVVCRKKTIRLVFQGLDGKKQEIEADGLRAIALQHEIDHLNGVVFTDRLGPIQKMMVLKKYKKLQAAKEDGNE